MASLEHDGDSRRFLVRFRYGGREYKRSLKTCDRREAVSVLGRIQETITLIERGRMTMPHDVDPAAFILSDGKRNGRPDTPKVVTLGELFKLYQSLLVTGVKEQSTISVEQIHMKHLKRHLKERKVVQSLNHADMQEYMERRLKEKWAGKPIGPDTVQKELATMRVIWNWAVLRGILAGPAPINGLKFPKRNEKLPFMTRQELERVIKRGGLSKDEQDELWESLYLKREEVQAVLEHVKESRREPFVYPMVVFVAHTGARRSEMLRSRVDDFDFESNTVLIREKKRSRRRAITYRRVDMTTVLRTTMKQWFEHHPGGQLSFCEPRGSNGDFCPAVPITPLRAHKHLRRALRKSDWTIIRGFHVFRHSFASNLAAAGVDQRIIDEWMGHQTEEMRKRYRHLVPEVRRKAIELLVPGNGSQSTRPQLQMERQQ